MENQEFNNTTQHAQEAAVPMKPKNWLTESILVTVIPMCLCLFTSLLGIVAIVFASRVNNLHLTGQYAEAENASKKAKMWVLITLGAVVAYLLYQIISIRIRFGSIAGFIEFIREQIEIAGAGAL